MDKRLIHDWPDIPDTPEQRALIAEHNAEVNRKFPKLVKIDVSVRFDGLTHNMPCHPSELKMGCIPLTQV